MDIIVLSFVQVNLLNSSTQWVTQISISDAFRENQHCTTHPSSEHWNLFSSFSIQYGRLFQWILPFHLWYKTCCFFFHVPKESINLILVHLCQTDTGRTCRSTESFPIPYHITIGVNVVFRMHRKLPIQIQFDAVWIEFTTIDKRR